LTASVSETEAQVSAYAEDSDRAKQFLALAKKYTDFSELTTQMLNEFVDKIIVHAPEKVDGDRMQEIEIYLKFIGRFELPAPELTAEEEKGRNSLKGIASRAGNGI
jgi:PX domain.